MEDYTRRYKLDPLVKTEARAEEEEATSVANHYTSRPNVQPALRGRSVIIHLRDFNNWTKSVLIREFVSQRNLKILDLACGKGGDLMKWDKARVSHVTGVGTMLLHKSFIHTFTHLLLFRYCSNFC